MLRILQVLIWVLAVAFASVFVFGDWYTWNVSKVYSMFCLCMAGMSVVELAWLAVKKIRRWQNVSGMN